MSDVLNEFQARFPEWVSALLEHLQISLVAILIAILIAIPAAILVMRHQKLKEFILQMTGVFQTIPSLALLGLFIPFLGIGRVPAIVALVIYAIFPILQNTVTGFEQIDPVLEEAGTAFGMNRKEKLLTYQIPLAMPVIISGIRTTTVLIIGTATLAALIGAGGLGSFILLGIDRNDSALILIGAISSALLAILFNILLKWIARLPLKQMGLIFLAVVLLTGASFMPQAFQFGGQDTLVVAGKLGAEPEILMNMYQQLIEQETDIEVEIKPNFGKTSFLYEALKSGEIDIYPEFTGTIVASLLEEDVAVETDPETVYQQAKDGIYAQDDLVLLKPMDFQNTYAVAVTKEFAQENQLETISDLHRVEDQSQAGFSLEFADRPDGGVGLQEVYGLNLAVSTMEPSLSYSAIATNDVQIIDVYSTDSQIIEYNLTLLEDDKQLFPPYQGAPLLREETLAEYPMLEDILNQLAGKITEEEMQQMNYAVNVEGESAQDVAHDYLDSIGLLK
ncbi:ABC transporter permease/substrate-binding protein [Aerococcaceae bacterium DSM 111020]|nr:ABC transporter permease/substrate-binding protein [Aerococcaceae bacterium DSM 111020]